MLFATPSLTVIKIAAVITLTAGALLTVSMSFPGLLPSLNIFGSSKHIDLTTTDNTFKYLLVNKREFIVKQDQPLKPETHIKCYFSTSSQAYFDDKCSLHLLSSREDQLHVNLKIDDFETAGKKITELEDISSHYILKISEKFHFFIGQHLERNNLIYLVQQKDTDKKYLSVRKDLDFEVDANSKALKSKNNVFYGKAKEDYTKPADSTETIPLTLKTAYTCKSSSSSSTEEDKQPCMVFKFPKVTTTLNNKPQPTFKDLIPLTNWANDLKKDNHLFVEFKKNFVGHGSNITNEDIDVYYQENKLTTITGTKPLYGNLGLEPSIFLVEKIT